MWKYYDSLKKITSVDNFFSNIRYLNFSSSLYIQKNIKVIITIKLTKGVSRCHTVVRTFCDWSYYKLIHSFPLVHYK